jgi:hypothetical protein
MCDGPDHAHASAVAEVQTEQTNDTHPPTSHTGWRTLVTDTAQDFVAFPKRKSTWVILGTGAAAALATHQADNYVEEHIVGNASATKFFKPGRWVGSSQVMVGSAVGCGWWAGIWLTCSERAAHEQAFAPRLRPYAGAPSLPGIGSGNEVFIPAQPTNSRMLRLPVGSRRCCACCCSGSRTTHDYRGSWPALIGATYVATSRLVDNRHFLSDVVFGAAVGTTAGWTVVGRHGRDQYALMPTPVRGGIAVNLTRLAN